LKLPFLNRKRYIVLECVTNHQGVLDNASVKMSQQAMRKKPLNEYYKPVTDFTYCWSRINTARVSVTIPSPCEMRFQSDGSGVVNYGVADKEVVEIDFDHDGDPSYGLDKSMCMTKIHMPWHLNEETGVMFVMARHIENRTPMNIVSGVMQYKHFSQVNIFNAISNFENRYKVDYKEPLVSLYPLSDLPLHVEVKCDKDRFEKLDQQDYNPHFSASGLKRTCSHAMQAGE